MALTQNPKDSYSRCKRQDFHKTAYTVWIFPMGAPDFTHLATADFTCPKPFVPPTRANKLQTSASIACKQAAPLGILRGVKKTLEIT